MPYREYGYDVRLIGEDIGVENYNPPKGVYGIIANPPCTMFSIARSNAKIPRDLREGIKLVKECLRIIWECQYDIDQNQRHPNLKFWVIENPATGFLKWFLGNPTFIYQPYEYGEAYTKKTALWGMFNLPIKPLLFNQIPKKRSIKYTIPIMSARNDNSRMNMRSKCCYNFAKAFFEVNQ